MNPQTKTPRPVLPSMPPVGSRGDCRCAPVRSPGSAGLYIILATGTSARAKRAKRPGSAVVESDLPRTISATHVRKRRVLYCQLLYSKVLSRNTRRAEAVLDCGTSCTSPDCAAKVIACEAPGCRPECAHEVAGGCLISRCALRMAFNSDAMQQKRFGHLCTFLCEQSIAKGACTYIYDRGWRRRCGANPKEVFII